MGHAHQRQKPNLRKPYPLVHHANGEKFNGKGKFHSKGDSFSQVNANVDQGLQKPHHLQPVPVKEPEPFTFDMNSADQLVADPSEIPSTFGISPRLNISPNGEISLGRSISFKQRNFNDDSDAESVNEHMDEDHDLLHKIRTARSAPNKLSGPAKLSETNTFQGINVHNGAQSGENLQLNASGDTISANNQGSSSSSGSGTISATGSTVVTSQKLSDTNTLQGIDVHNGAQSGEYLQLNASGDTISANNQGSSSSSGSGTISVSGSTTVTNSGSSSGWKATK